MSNPNFSKILQDNFNNSLNELITKTNNSLAECQLVLALSGGLDSVVLLDLLAEFADNVKHNCSAVYIDHQLQADSKEWLKFNSALCEKFNIPFSSYQVEITKSNSQSIEALARTARYGKFAELIDKPNKILLTAHHLNDQAETFLLQLVRSAGPRGLSAMPKIKKFAAGYHLRPLLAVSRSELASYAEDKQLKWVKDNSNFDQKFDRNYLRHEIMPLLSQRWPHIIKNIASSARNCADNEDLLNSYLAQDYYAIVSTTSNDVTCSEYAIVDILKLTGFDLLKQKALLRYWLRNNIAEVPERKVINQIISNCIQAKQHKNPEVMFSNYVIKRFKNKLYLLAANTQNDNLSNSAKANNKSNCDIWQYQLGTRLDIPNLGLKINSYLYDSKEPQSKSANIIAVPQQAKITIKFRMGGERCRPIGRGGSVSIKKLLQEANIPHWQRAKIPLLYVNDQIACVIGLKTCEGFDGLNTGPSEQSWVVFCDYDNSQ